MKLIMAIILSLLLVGCLSSQGQSHDHKVTNQEIHEEGGTHQPAIMSPRNERSHRSSQY